MTNKKLVIHVENSVEVGDAKPSKAQLQAFLDYDNDDEEHSEPSFRLVMDWLKKLAEEEE